MVLLLVIVSSRIVTKSVQIVQVITFLGSANQLERISLPKLNFYPYAFSRIFLDYIQVQNEKFAQKKKLVKSHGDKNIEIIFDEQYIC